MQIGEYPTALVHLLSSNISYVRFQAGFEIRAAKKESVNGYGILFYGSLLMAS